MFLGWKCPSCQTASYCRRFLIWKKQVWAEQNSSIFTSRITVGGKLMAFACGGHLVRPVAAAKLPISPLSSMCSYFRPEMDTTMTHVSFSSRVHCRQANGKPSAWLQQDVDKQSFNWFWMNLDNPTPLFALSNLTYTFLYSPLPHPGLLPQGL